MKRIAIIFLLGTMTYALSAQVLNIEKKRLDQDTTTRILGNFSALFDLHQQQGKIVDIDLDANLAKNGHLNSYLLIGDLRFFRARGESVSSKGFVHGRAVLYRKKQFSPELFAQLQYDELRGMNERKLAGLGVKYSVLSKTNIHIHLGAAAMYEVEQWAFNEQIKETKLIKGSNYISCQLVLNNNLHYNAALYYQLPYQGTYSYRLLTDHFLNLDVTKRIAFLIKFNHWFDSDPIVEVSRLAYSLSSGMKVRF